MHERNAIMTKSPIHGREMLRVQKDVTEKYGTDRIVRSYWEDGTIRERRDHALPDGTVRKDPNGWREKGRLICSTIDAVRAKRLADGWIDCTQARQSAKRDPNPNAISPTSSLARLARAAFPRYHGRTYQYRIADTVHVHDYWDGGSRTYVNFVNICTGQMLTSAAMPDDARQHAGNLFNLPVGEARLQPGTVAVEHGIFCGKDIGLIVVIHPQDASGNLLAT